MRTLRLLVALPGTLVLSACIVRNTSSAPAPVEELRGHYSVASGSWFTACGAPPADSMWVTVTGNAVAQVEAARRQGLLSASSPVFVRWTAVVTRDGRIGPRGPGAPALLVQEVRTLRPATDQDCP